MLNINQNFDLKAPVFNFDRDYFNSVEELNAYDTSNVPNHFVTNVAGMLYLFTNGKWVSILSTEPSDDDDQWTLYLGKRGETSCYINGDSIGAECFVAESYSNQNIIDSMYTKICNSDNNKSISLSINEAYDIDESNGDSTVNMYLIDGDYRTDLNAKHGFKHKTDDGSVTLLDGYGLNIEYSNSYNLYADNKCIVINNEENKTLTYIGSDTLDNYLLIGSDEKFKISRPADNTEGATIIGVKSIAAFANPSATKVWATDGSTVDLSTKANASDLNAKANASDVLLKKSASGGYYIEANSNQLGSKAFAANSICTASGNYSFAEGYGKATSSVAHAEGEYTTASGYGSHTEGSYTVASGTCAHAEGDHTQATQPGAHAEGYYTLAKSVGSHAEGYYTASNANYSHAEGHYTKASGFCAHALGTYNIDNKNAIHSVGIGNSTTRKNAEYIYTKNNEYGNGLTDDPKNGYKYLIGVGGYDGISTDNTTYKSVQEVIADLTARIEQLETKVRALEAANTTA